MIPILIVLIRLNGKSIYWTPLLRIERQEGRDEHNTLMLYRLMYDTAAKTVCSDYIEMAQLLGDAALPAEAQMVLQKALSAGLIKDEQKERTTRSLKSFQARLEVDKKGLMELVIEAAKNPAGEFDVEPGKVSYGFGDYQDVVSAINPGIQTGQLEHADDAYVYLGRSRAAPQDDAAAKEAFDHLNAMPSASRRVADLWRLYADTRL